MLTERSIINLLLWVGGLILGPYLISSVLWGNFVPLGICAASIGLFWIFGVARDRLCILPLAGWLMAGHLQFLPGRMTFSDLGVISIILYFLIAYTALRRAKIMTGPLYFFVPIVIVTGIIIYHDHDVGLRMSGGGKEGGRGSIAVVLAAAAYLCGVSMDSPSPKFLQWAPVWCGGASVLSSLPNTLSTYVPSTAPFLYIFTDNINVQAYTSEILDDGGLVRNFGQAGLGGIVVLILLSYFPLYTLWRPNRWWVVFLILICAPLVVSGGFRSYLATFGLSVFVAAACYSGWRALLLLPLMLGCIFMAAFLQTSHLVKFPESFQRSLAFFPGDWDPEVMDSTLSSNEFRSMIRKVYIAEDASKSPLFGNGLTYNSADFEHYTMLAKYHDTPDGYYNIKEFVTGKMFHTGWISAYDSIGIVGSMAFVFFALSLIFATGRMIFGRNSNRGSPLFPLKVWMFCNILPSFVAYCTVFGDFKGTFPTFCCYAIVWTHLNRIEKFGYRPSLGLQPVPFDPERANLPAPA